ncbi:chaperonin 10-like protein [Truncatella angustata]|uniref:Chaperonin 10-like protein n=1 Tax=Truncatella angustata TaxID=152316 RepID=A0A9P8UB29_9PEZI|nr:chaperonin 10-like protein [Truncatella angustata]KAH6638572.1 chaperonin 10-like protein [Truncatella angustata]KAH8194257.1 hypothetical protein TruAng_011578 [Truncatella angustata]
MKALVLNAEARTASVEEVAVPTAAQGEAVVKVFAIALNPVDALYTLNPLGKSGRIVGSDFSGTVFATADGDGDIKIGTKVAGFLQGASSVNERPGAFAEYVTCPVDLLWRMPEDLTFEEAATISLCALTAAQALFYRLDLPAPFDWVPGTPRIRPGGRSAGLPDRVPLTVLVYGASTSVGLFVAQLLRSSVVHTGASLKMIGVASQKNFPSLHSEPYLYDTLIDYRDQDWSRQVLEQTNEHGVAYAIDCISEGTTVKNVAGVLSDGGKMAIVRSREGGAWDAEGLPENIRPSYGAVWEGLGVDVQYQGLVVPASSQSRTFTTAFFKWLSSGRRINGNPVRLMPGGLENITHDGFVLLGSGAMKDRGKDRREPWMRPISAEKLVYRPF